MASESKRTTSPDTADVAETASSFKGSIDKFALSSTAETSKATRSTRSSAKRSYTEALSFKSTASPRPAKKSSSYAPPSKYAHLKGVPDQLGDEMLCMFIGLNPGIATSQAGHCYASPSNLFWKLMFWGGLTTRQCRPQDDVILPSEFNLGTTNIVGRPTANQAELSKEEMDEGVADLERKCRQYRPESVCIVGKAIWESIWRARHGGKNMTKQEFKFGWQDAKENMGVDKKNGYPGAKVYVVPSTSGLAAGYTLDFKKQMWKDLGDWANGRRAERAQQKKEPKDDEPSESALGEGAVSEE